MPTALFNKKTYELPMADGYVRHWGLHEAVREFIQNALDSESPFEYEVTDDTLKIHSRFATLPINSLLLGTSSKADNPRSIGSFGEGYKIAMLVLTREGYPVTVHNGDRVWRPVFRHSRTFDAQVLCIDDTPASQANEGTTFEIGGLSPAEIEQIRDNCLFMQEHVGQFHDTPHGRILRERPGKLFVGGLFVCDTGLEFGYDIKPEYLRLERDRQTVSTFDLKWMTKEVWLETERYEEVATLLEQETPDLEYAEHGAPELVKEACYRLFQSKYPGHVAARDQDELEKLVENGMTKTIYVGGAYGALIRGAPSYQQQAIVEAKTPRETLQDWFEKNKQYMRRKAIVSFKRLIKESADWRIK